MIRTFLAFLLFLSSAALWAQNPGPFPPGPSTPPVPFFPPAIRLFLDLSDAQVQAIQRQNGDLARFTGEKSLRAAQVQAEIAQETARQALDPQALGLRYTELEVIRREIETEFGRTRERIRQILTEQQRTRLRAFDDLLRLLPIYSEAVAVNLVDRSPLAVPLPAVRGGVFFSGALPATEAGQPEAGTASAP